MGDKENRFKDGVEVGFPKLIRKRLKTLSLFARRDHVENIGIETLFIEPGKEYNAGLVLRKCGAAVFIDKIIGKDCAPTVQEVEDEIIAIEGGNVQKMAVQTIVTILSTHPRRTLTINYISQLRFFFQNDG